MRTGALGTGRAGELWRVDLVFRSLGMGSQGDNLFYLWVDITRAGMGIEDDMIASLCAAAHWNLRSRAMRTCHVEPDFHVTARDSSWIVQDTCIVLALLFSARPRQGAASRRVDSGKLNDR